MSERQRPYATDADPGDETPADDWPRYVSPPPKATRPASAAGMGDTITPYIQFPLLVDPDRPALEFTFTRVGDDDWLASDNWTVTYGEGTSPGAALLDYARDLVLLCMENLSDLTAERDQARRERDAALALLWEMDDYAGPRAEGSGGMRDGRARTATPEQDHTPMPVRIATVPSIGVRVGNAERDLPAYAYSFAVNRAGRQERIVALVSQPADDSQEG